MLTKQEQKLESDVAYLTKFIHKEDLGKKTSELENAIRIVLQELRDRK